MKEKFECEVCHTVFESKERALACEEEHKTSEISFPVKEILYCDVSDTFYVYTYPDARYKKNNNIITLYKGAYWKCKYSFYFEEIQEDGNDLKVYTTNFDDEYEKELINRIINYKIALLNEKIARLKRKIGKIEVSHIKVENR